MRLKTFTAKTMQEAMTEVRAALGPDAIIVSSRSEGKGGIVRVVAAIDQAMDMTERETDAPAPASLQEPEIGALSVAEALAHHRIPDSLQQTLLRLAANVKAETPALELAAAFDMRLRFAPLEDVPQRPLFFIGLPGAGKTVTTARLAADAALEDKPVALITTDTLRAGGIEQLKHYGDLAGIPVGVADSADALAAHIMKARADNISRIYIDTPGVNPYEREEMDNLQALLTLADGEPVLALPAGTDADEAHDLAMRFSDIGCRRMIVTRLDTSRRYGGILTAALGGPLNISGVTASPFLGDKVEIVNPVSLARLFTVRMDAVPDLSKEKKWGTS